MDRSATGPQGRAADDHRAVGSTCPTPARPEAERALDRAGVAAEALCAFDGMTDGVYAGGGVRPRHPIWDDEPGTVRACVRHEYTAWTSAEHTACFAS
ncbi:hypothetical protein [Streptomyces sp. NPDC046385]|uniref:hypothetical protein n=1 Tax=Streptomyces sp. NPDC046385 TaxID=3154918 RepID=UPI0034080DE4